jgi:hypothetical protein
MAMSGDEFSAASSASFPVELFGGLSARLLAMLAAL